MFCWILNGQIQLVACFSLWASEWKILEADANARSKESSFLHGRWFMLSGFSCHSSRRQFGMFRSLSWSKECKLAKCKQIEIAKTKSNIPPCYISIYISIYIYISYIHKFAFNPSNLAGRFGCFPIRGLILVSEPVRSRELVGYGSKCSTIQSAWLDIYIYIILYIYCRGYAYLSSLQLLLVYYVDVNYDVSVCVYIYICMYIYIYIHAFKSVDIYIESHPQYT